MDNITPNAETIENTGITNPEVTQSATIKPEDSSTKPAKPNRPTKPAVPPVPPAPTNQGEETKAPGPEAPTETAKAVAAVIFNPIQFRSPIKSMVYRMPDGNHIVFADGRFTAKTEAEYNFLKNHIDFNRSLFKEK